MARRVAWVGIALGVAYLIFIGGGWWGIYTSSLRLLTMLIAGAALATWLFVGARNPAWRPRTLMWPAIIACLGSLALSTALSAQPRVSLEYLAYAVVLAALYLLLVRLFADPFFRPRLLALFTMLFGAVAVLYVGSVLVGWIEWWRLAGLTVPPLRPGFEGLTFGNPSAALTMVALLAVPVVGLTTQEIPALRHVQAVAAVDDRNWPAAVEPARDATAFDPGIAPYQLTAGLVASAMGDHQGAAAAFERVVAQSDLPDAWLDLAAEHVALADTMTAGEAIERALRLGEGRPQIAMAAGDLAFRTGDRATALNAFGAAIAARPSLAGDPWWRTDVALAELYPRVMASAMARNPAGAWEIEMMAGHAASPVDDVPRRIAAAWNGDSTAVQNLIASCSADPMNVDLLTWCARVLRHLGDDQRAAAYTERVGLISLGAAEGTFELRVTQDGASGFDLAPPLWGKYTYRRTTARDILVDSLVHLHLE